MECGSGAARWRRSPRCRDRISCTATAAASAARAHLRSRTGGIDNRPAIATRLGRVGTPPRRRSAAGTLAGSGESPAWAWPEHPTHWGMWSQPDKHEASYADLLFRTRNGRHRLEDLLFGLDDTLIRTEGGVHRRTPNVHE